MSSNCKFQFGNLYEGKNKGNVEFASEIKLEAETADGVLVGGRAKGDNAKEAKIIFKDKIDAKLSNATKTRDPKENRDITNYQLTEDEPKSDAFHIKGHVTIINQEFRSREDRRHGSLEDVRRLTATFKRLGIEPNVKPDLNLREIEKEIEVLSSRDWSDHKLFVMVYMSHGKKHGVVSAADTKFILKDVIINPIMRNQTLRGIPKIFITVACRGDRYYARDGEENDGCFTSKLTDIDIDYSECIISYSTYKGFYSIRTGKGTYFIQHLCDNIDEDNGNSDIHSLFAKVNGELAEMKKQVPVFKSTMSKISLRDLATKY